MNVNDEIRNLDTENTIHVSIDPIRIAEADKPSSIQTTVCDRTSRLRWTIKRKPFDDYFSKPALMVGDVRLGGQHFEGNGWGGYELKKPKLLPKHKVNCQLCQKKLMETVERICSLHRFAVDAESLLVLSDHLKELQDVQNLRWIELGYEFFFAL